MKSFIFRLLATVFVASSLSVFAFAGTKKVLIENIQFNPAEISLKAGDKVEWENKDLVPHTVTSKGNFDSKSIAPGKKWTHRFKRAGEFPYICNFHPNMKATLKVEK